MTKQEQTITNHWNKLSQKQIGDKLGISRQLVGQIGIRLKLKKKIKDYKTDALKVDVDDFKAYYQDNTNKECAKYFGVELGSIRYLINMLNIKKSITEDITRTSIFNKPQGWSPLLSK